MTITKAGIEQLIANAASGDIFSDVDGGFVTVMAKSSKSIQQDIPVVTEMYSLLEYFLPKLTLINMSLGPGYTINPIAPSVVICQSTNKLVALLPVPAGALSEIAFWLADAIPSAEVKKLPGILALPFSLETHSETTHLIPDWFACFYVDGKTDHCVPILGLKSVVHDQRFGGDWVAVALHRMTTYSLPHEKASEAAGDDVQVVRKAEPGATSFEMKR